MAYRNDVEALEARRAALEFEVEAKVRERDQAAQLLHEARARAKLPVLDHIRIASPCTADWNEMVGDDRVRHCGTCNKDVFNLSQMTRDEAESLVRDKHGKLCARYFQRKDGTILTSDCAIGQQRRRRRRFIAAGAAALLAGGGVLAYEQTRMSWVAPAVEPEHEHLLGEVSVPADLPGNAYAVQGGIAMPPDPPPVESPIPAGPLDPAVVASPRGGTP